MRLFLLLITITGSFPAEVKWMPNKSFNVPINFKNRKLPCSKQAVVFPERVSEAIKMEALISVREFILPKDGELLFEDATITFGADDHDNCTETKNSYYLPRSESYWSDPDVWSSSRFNEATPDAERLPCYNDEVIFPIGSQFTVLMPKLSQYVRKLTVNGYSYTTNTFRTFFFIENLPQTFVLNDYYSTGLIVEDKGCNNPKGCPCQKNALEIDCTVKFCEKPKCLDPVQPKGHCCKICGGYLLIENDDQFDMLVFEENVVEVIKLYGKDRLAYHIGILPDSKIQLVVVEKGQYYTGISAQAVNEIEYRSNSKGLQSMAHISGGPTSTAGFGAKIAFSMLLIVVLVMGGVYIYYYKTPKLPEIRYPVVGRRARDILNRFSRRSESVVSLTSRRDSTATLGSSFGTAFRNPMYDSKRGRVQVAESVEEDSILFLK